MDLVGHRGSSFTAPENTIASVKLAFEHGACGVEFDIQRSSDGEIFLLHDDTLRRTAPASRPAGLNMTQEEYEANLDKDVSLLSYRDFIRHIDVGSWKGGKYHSERPSLLVDVMKEIPKGRFALCEVKGGDHHTARDVALLTKEHGWTADQLMFIGFDMGLMKDLKAKLDELGSHPIPVIFLQDAYDEAKALETVQMTKDAGLDGVDFEADPSVVTTKVREVAERAGLITGVWVWTKALPQSDTLPNMLRLKGAGIDFFTSDLPPDIRGWAQTA